MGRPRSTKELVLQISDGVLSNVTDAVLVTLYCFAEYATLPRKHWSSVSYLVQQHLDKFSSTTIKRAFSYLCQQGHISASDELPRITDEGIQKIHARIPVYKQDRPWDKNFYLISYDLPRIRNADRNYLRQIIKLLGCVRLQHSTWLTPYHPQAFLPQALDARNLSQIIAVSRLDITIGVGRNDMTKLIHQLYPLLELNQRYDQFITAHKNQSSLPKVAFAYWQILRDDPQLPFELLPKNWLGETAYSLFKEKTSLT